MKQDQNNEPEFQGFTWYESNIHKVKPDNTFSDNLRYWRAYKMAVSNHGDAGALANIDKYLDIV